MSDLHKLLIKVASVEGDMFDFKLVDGVTSCSQELKQSRGKIDVEGIDICWVQNWWKELDESLLDLIEEEVRDVMLKKKSQKPRRSAPSEWTRSIGYSTQKLGASGHEKKAPFSVDKGISSAGLREKDDLKIFQHVERLVALRFKEFGRLFGICGRVDLKYNTTISKETSHFDKQDVCHQVMFTLGRSAEALIVEENTNTENSSTPTNIFCHRDPVAFDGRFQHWVERCKQTTQRDRISVVCYLTDAPKSFQHKKMTVKELQDKYTANV